MSSLAGNNHNANGRPAGPVRRALLDALMGTRGDFEVLARTSCLPVPVVRSTLKNLRREQVVMVAGDAPGLTGRRARAVYAAAPPTDQCGSSDGSVLGAALLSCTLAQAWRGQL